MHSEYIEGIDILSARLAQAKAAVNVLWGNFLREEGSDLNDKTAGDALWAIQELLVQALAAFEKVSANGKPRETA